MDKSKAGGKGDSASTSNAAPPRKLVTLSTLRQARESRSASKEAAVQLKSTTRFVVSLGSSTSPAGTARMLSERELEELRATKRAVLEWTRLVVGDTENK